MKRYLLILLLCALGSLGYVRAQQELPLPSVPSELTTPSERAEYVVTHFWDAMDFTDSSLASDEIMIEQAFANFLSIFPYAPGAARTEAVEILLDKASLNPNSYSFINRLAEKYLYESESPLFNEEYLILFLEEFADSDVEGYQGQDRAAGLLELARKNRPGSQAPDFEFTTVDGKTMSLHDIESAGNLLLIFFDPSCEHCDETIGLLSNDNRLHKAIADSSISVAAIYSGSDRSLWQIKADRMPKEWTIGINSGDIEEEELYDFMELPTIFLLNPTKTILLKDITKNQLSDLLEQL